MKNKIRDKKGSSLVEILVAIALFAVVSVPILGLFLGSAIMIKQSKENTKMAEIERHIKADVMLASSDNTVRLHSYPYGAPDKELPSTGGAVTMTNYGILDYEYNKVNDEYMYSLTGIPNTHASTNRLYATQSQNESEGTRYRVDIFQLKSRGLSTSDMHNFKNVKTFFLETT